MKNKIILYIAESLDGYIAKKNGSVDWLEKYMATGKDYGYKKFFSSIKGVIVGNTTYKQFPQKYDGKPAFIFSKKKKENDENLTYVNEDVKKFLKKLNPIGDIWLVGGANLVKQFLKQDLIDEYIITIIPEFLGSGIPLFNDTNYLKKLKLIETKSFGNVVQLHYKNNIL